MLAGVLLGGAAGAEDLAIGVTDDVIRITSNFTGADLTVFGTIEAPDPYQDADKRDLVVVVSGPDNAETVRKQARVAGVWVNAEAVQLTRVPALYRLASTKPLDKIASEAVLKLNAIGLSALPIEGPDRPDFADFRAALIRNKMAQGLYVETAGSVEMISPALFSARIKMPANTPVGLYTAEAFLFRDGQVVAAYSTTLEVDKSGIERTLYHFAMTNGALYGSCAIVVAALMGLGAAFIFRERE